MTTRTWTKVGTEVVGAPLDEGCIIDRSAVVRAIGSLEWQEIPKGGKLEAPAMPGLGISAAIKQLRIPKVSHVAWSSELAPYGFYGIRGHYKNGDAEIFIVDMGTHLTPVCTEFTPKVEVPS
jgi:hypothetical protein